MSISLYTRRLVNGDYSFGQGRNNLATDSEALLQRCKSKLLQYQGEWFLNQNDGTPWQSVIGQSRDDALLKRTVRNTLLSIENVQDVLNLQVYFEAASRQASVVCQLSTVFGQIGFNETFSINNGATR